MISVLILCLFLDFVANNTPKFAEMISTRSTAVKGILLCGDTPVIDTKVRLFRKTSNNFGEVLSTKQTASEGHFEIEGDTVGRADQDIEPMIRFCHQCYDDPKSDLKKINLDIS
ncbi:Transthyretin-like family protein [Onchocerca flexuosa]|uniref:Transthyretin-like family protein n=1 Tax=Onchocerca flexuosa TaxID=387005 RepID=A0A238C2S5_9BILA|nr:Transthyretin-like family protein [Onchocerca flexuosa]